MACIDITRFFWEGEMPSISGSVFELGDNAASITFGNALRAADKHADLLPTDDDKQEFREYVTTFGAWSREEIAAFTDRQLIALLLQLVAGDIREGGLDDDDPPDWDAYTKRVEQGSVAGNLSQDDVGRVYYSF